MLDGLAGERVIRHGRCAHPAGVAYVAALVGGVSVSRALGRGILTSRALACRPLSSCALSSCALARSALGCGVWASRTAVRCLPACCLRIRECSGRGRARDLRRGGIDISFASAIVASISVVSGGRGIGPDVAVGRSAVGSVGARGGGVRAGVGSGGIRASGGVGGVGVSVIGCAGCVGGIGGVAIAVLAAVWVGVLVAVPVGVSVAVGSLGGLPELALGIEVFGLEVFELVFAEIRVMVHDLSSSMYVPDGRVGSSR